MGFELSDLDPSNIDAGTLGFIIGGPIGSSLGTAYEAGEKEEEALARQKEAQAQELAFAREIYEDWQETYGPIEQNLAQFYGSLSPESLAATGLEKQQKSFQTMQEQSKRSFAQRGIDSPAQEFMENVSKLYNAEVRAKIRTEAPFKVAQAKGQFVASGRGAQAQGIAGMRQAYAGQTQFYGQQADRAAAEKTAAIQAASDFAGTAMTFGMGGGGMGGGGIPMGPPPGQPTGITPPSYYGPNYVPPGGSFTNPWENI